MKYYKSNKGDVFAYDPDGSQDAYIKPDLVPMTPEEVEAHINPPPVVVVPSSVTMRQARLALLGEGLLDFVEDAIASLPEDIGRAARIEWEFATHVHRSNKLIGAVTAQLGMSEQEVDDLFITASQIGD